MISSKTWCPASSSFGSIYFENDNFRQSGESKEDSGKYGGKNEANRMVDEGKEEGCVRTEWRFALGFQGRSVGLNGEREEGGELTRSYLLLRTSDFHWSDASYLWSDLTLSNLYRHLDSVHPRIAEAHSRQTMAPI